MKKYIVLLVTIVVVGCQATVTLPSLPVPTQPMQVVSSALVVEKLKAYPNVKDSVLADSIYVVPEGEYSTKLLSTVYFIFRSLNVVYKAEANDCDNFSNYTKWLYKFAFRYSVAEPLIFEIHVRQVSPWGGVGAGGNHSLILTYTTEGLRVYEPQTDFEGPLKAYPNIIYRIL